MAYQAVFKRCELKYLITREQQQRLLAAMAPHMIPDQYGRTSIRNLYFDTDSFRLIRRSIERPAYKEKLRVRSYGTADSDRPVFVELKKKYDSVVYKRRLSLPEQDAMDWLSGRSACPRSTQIAREIDYTVHYYQSLHPVVFLCYEREAFVARRDDSFRVTFDDRILARQEQLSLQSEVWGTPLLEEDRVLMEIKCSGGIPLWMTHALSQERIYKTTFSKYGTAYRTMIYPNCKGDCSYA